MEPGDEIFVPLKSEKEYNSQRVMFYRALKRMKALDSNIGDLGHCKQTINETLYLKIFSPSKEIKVMKLVNGELVEAELPPDAKTSDEILEEKNFELWLKELETNQVNKP